MRLELTEGTYRRFIVFTSEDHSAAGGLGDASGDFDTLEEAAEHAGAEVRKFRSTESHILDREEGRCWNVIREKYSETGPLMIPGITGTVGLK